MYRMYPIQKKNNSKQLADYKKNFNENKLRIASEAAAKKQSVAQETNPITIKENSKRMSATGGRTGKKRGRKTGKRKTRRTK